MNAALAGPIHNKRRFDLEYEGVINAAQALAHDRQDVLFSADELHWKPSHVASVGTNFNKHQHAEPVDGHYYIRNGQLVRASSNDDTDSSILLDTCAEAHS